MPWEAPASYGRIMSEHPNVTVINRMTAAVFENDREALSDIFTNDMGAPRAGPASSAG